MCFDPGSGLFIAVLAAAAALALSTVFALRRFVREARRARDVQGWLEAMLDHGPQLMVNGVWIFVGLIVARSCFVFL